MHSVPIFEVEILPTCYDTFSFYVGFENLLIRQGDFLWPIVLLVLLSCLLEIGWLFKEKL